jgi:Carboxypeptidase regulatory-like domain
MKLHGHINNVPFGESATVELCGDTVRSTTTDESGDYEFNVPPGSYEIIFSLAGHKFNPPSISGTWSQDSAMPPVTDPGYRLEASDCQPA